MEDAVSFALSIKEEELSEPGEFELDNIELDESRTCAYITAFKNFKIFNINCLYCETTFSIQNCNNFIKHVQEQHKLCDDENTDDTTKSTPDAMEITIKTEEGLLSDASPAPSEIEYSVGSEEEFISEPEEDTFETTEIVSTKTTKKPKGVPHKLDLMINVETTDEAIVFGFIDGLRSYYRLWYTPKIKQASSEKTFREFYFNFIQKYQLKLRRQNMFDSVQIIRDWYQKMFENENFITLKYPQSEYYRKLAEFMPDKLDGKSCEVCKRVLPDNLQHYAHKLQEHEEIVVAQQDPANVRVSGVPKTQIDDYLRARYPITEPLNFECQVCFQKIPARWKLIHHIKTHIDLREYICDICGATFIRKILLMKHLRRHKGENKITCKICGEEFNDFSPLTNHRLTFHRAIEGTIEEIEKSNRIKAKGRRGKHGTEVFKRHVDPTTKKLFYACCFCSKKYAFQSGLSKHLNRYHKEIWLPKKQKATKKIISK